MRTLTLILLFFCLIPDVQSQTSCPDTLDASELVNQHRSSSLSGNGDWEYTRSYTNADLNGDRKQESIHLLSDIEMVDGKPAWDDGQLWEIIIEEPTGDKTSVFLEYVQLGTVEINLVSKDASQELLLIIRQGADIRILSIIYNNPGDFYGCKHYEGLVESYSKNWE